jgi:chromosome segregation ATPase
MTRWGPVEMLGAEMQDRMAAAAQEIAMLRDEVNRLDDLISMLVEQGGQANVRAESAEDERDMLREVNRAQAENYTNLARQLADREEQLRRAQEKIRATALRELQAWGQAQDAWEAQKAAEAERDNATAMLICERAKWDVLHDELESVEAERDRAWNEAIEAAGATTCRLKRGWQDYGRDMGTEFECEIDALNDAIAAIRSLAKEAGE